MKHLNTPWSTAVEKLSASGHAYVLITLLGVRGSAPRNSGTKMVVADETTYDTIGGGHLEFKAIEIAQNMLRENTTAQLIEHFPLGPSLGQCCGGSTSVLFEVFEATGVNLMVFGAGHVSKALMPILAGLPCRVRWVDNRDDMLEADLAPNIEAIHSPYPVDEISAMPANSYFLVMTHNHQLDFELCEAVLKRNDFTYLGLIGSDTKWQRFQKRFDFKNVPAESVARMSCPVGLSEVPGKLPMEVAVSMAGEIIQHYQRNLPDKPTQQGMHWKDLKTLLTPNTETKAGSEKAEIKNES